MTTRREFLGGAAVTSIVATLPLARAAGQVRPNPPTSLLVDGRSNTAADNGYYGDPYSGYATWYVNGTTGVNTPNPGVDRRPAGFVYRNYENALIDVFYAGNPGLRRIVVQAGTYAPLSSVLGGYFPAGGPDAAHPCVIQGEASLTAPPVIDGGLSSWPAFCVGSRGGYNTAQIDLGNIVIRKLEIRNFTCASVYFYWGSSTNITIEYCNFHSNRYPAANPSASGAIAVTSANCLSGLNVRHCKFSDFRTLAGGYQLNCVPFETYGSSNVTFQNCLFQGAYAAIRMKLLETDSHGFGRADNFRILNNIFANCYAAISVGTGSTVYLANSNWVIAGNLVYGPPLNVGGGTAALAWVNAGYVDSSAGLGQGISWTNNTIAEDVSSGFGWIGASGITENRSAFAAPIAALVE